MLYFLPPKTRIPAGRYVARCWRRCVIPGRSDGKRGILHGKDGYGSQDLVENACRHVRGFRGGATRYDKLGASIL